MVADNPSQGVVFDDPRGKIEDDSPQTGHDADQNGQAEQSCLRANPPLGQKKELGNQAEPVAKIGHSGGYKGPDGAEPRRILPRQRSAD